MSLAIRHKYQIYLLATVLLLMQSFAIWHETIHPFHISSDQCESFEAICHTPIIDIAIPIALILTSYFSIVRDIPSVTYLPQRVRDNFSIRAPPSFS